jgi:acyl-CoA thioester hydrolase
MSRDEFTLLFPNRVRWAEVDRQDVVFNPHYFTYFDLAVCEYWRAARIAYPKGYVDVYGCDTFAVKATAQFHASARYDELLELGCRVTRIGSSSLVFSLGVWRAEEHLTSGELVYVNTDLATRSATPWPEPFVASVLAFERVAPRVAVAAPARPSE